MQAKLTPKQERFWAYLQEIAAREGQVPSLRRAAQDLGISHAAVAQHLRLLEQKGYVRRAGRYSRTVHLLNPARQTAGVQRWREVPIIGRITAGLPMYAQTEWDGSLVLDSTVFRGTHLFVLRIKGDSMRDAGIRDGDLAVCQPRQYAHNGEIVVALIGDEEATVKRFFLHADHIELRPANPRYGPLWLNFDEVLVQGKVVGIQRGPEGID
jgi:repressor LexA